MSQSSDPLRTAIETTDLPALVAHYYPDSGATPGKRGAVFAVWRGDRHKSFSLFISRTGSWLWRDHGTGETGNSFAFLVDITGFSRAEAAAMLVENCLPHSPSPNGNASSVQLPERPEGAPPMEDGLWRALNQSRIKPFVHPLSRILLSVSASEACVRGALEQPKGKDAQRIIEASYQALKAAGRKRAEHGRLKETYEYQDEWGNPLFEVVRFEPKNFAQRRPTPDGKWIWGLGAGGYRKNAGGNWVQADPGKTVEATFGETELVLYHLPQLKQAVRRGETVFVVEGEKDVHTLESLGFVATTNPDGALKWSVDTNKGRYGQALQGASVVQLVDNDEAGHDHAARVKEALVGYAVSYHSLVLPGLPLKGDVSDWIAAGHSRDDLLTALNTKK